jgi:hypothetical protein
MSTMSVCNTAFEKRGPTGVQSVHASQPDPSQEQISHSPKRRSILSTTTTLIGLFELSANTFEIVLIFCASEKPTILSGVMSLMKGNSDAWAIVAARAVLPVPGGPWRRRLTSGVRVEVRTCSTKSCPERSKS